MSTIHRKSWQIQGFARGSIKKEIRNLTAPDRTGAPGSPLALQDYVLISYRISNDRPHDLLAIDEELPAALEVMNPDLPSIRKAFPFPDPNAGNEATLAYADQQLHRVRLFFEKLPAGTNHYTVLARVVGTGSFSWPATQAGPLYDRRVSAATADSALTAR